MKRLLVLMVLLGMCSSANAIGLGMVTDADTLPLPFKILDATGLPVAIADGDSLYISVFSPSGTVVYKDSILGNNAGIKKQDWGSIPDDYTFPKLASVLNGAATTCGTYVVKMRLVDISLALSTPTEHSFQLLSYNLNTTLDSLFSWTNPALHATDAELVALIGDTVKDLIDPPMDTINKVYDSIKAYDGWIAKQTTLSADSTYSKNCLDSLQAQDGWIAKQSTLSTDSTYGKNCLDSLQAQDGWIAKQTTLSADSIYGKNCLDSLQAQDGWIAKQTTLSADSVYGKNCLDSLQTHDGWVAKQTTLSADSVYSKNCLDSLQAQDGWIATTAKQTLLVDSVNAILDTLQLYDAWVATTAKQTLLVDSINAILDTLQVQDGWIATAASIVALPGNVTDSVWLSSLAVYDSIAGSFGDSAQGWGAIAASSLDSGVVQRIVTAQIDSFASITDTLQANVVTASDNSIDLATDICNVLPDSNVATLTVTPTDTTTSNQQVAVMPDNWSAADSAALTTAIWKANFEANDGVAGSFADSAQGWGATGGGLDSSQTAAAVWGAPTANHVVAGSFGLMNGDLATLDEIADTVWSVQHTVFTSATGTFGKFLDTTVSTRSVPAGPVVVHDTTITGRRLPDSTAIYQASYKAATTADADSTMDSTAARAMITDILTDSSLFVDLDSLKKYNNEIVNLDATVSSRSTLAAADNIGINWADVAAPTTTVALSGTTIGTSTALGTSYPDSAGFSRIMGRKIWGVAAGVGADSVAVGSRHVNIASVTADAIEGGDLADAVYANIVDSTWNEPVSGHTTANTFGDTLTQPIVNDSVKVDGSALAATASAIGPTTIAADAITSSELAATAATEVRDATWGPTVDMTLKSLTINNSAGTALSLTGTTYGLYGTGATAGAGFVGTTNGSGVLSTGAGTGYGFGMTAGGSVGATGLYVGGSTNGHAVTIASASATADGINISAGGDGIDVTAGTNNVAIKGTASGGTGDAVYLTGTTRLRTTATNDTSLAITASGTNAVGIVATSTASGGVGIYINGPQAGLYTNSSGGQDIIGDIVGTVTANDTLAGGGTVAILSDSVHYQGAAAGLDVNDVYDTVSKAFTNASIALQPSEWSSADSIAYQGVAGSLDSAGVHGAVIAALNDDTTAHFKQVIIKNTGITNDSAAFGVYNTGAGTSDNAVEFVANGSVGLYEYSASNSAERLSSAGTNPTLWVANTGTTGEAARFQISSTSNANQAVEVIATKGNGLLVQSADTAAAVMIINTNVTLGLDGSGNPIAGEGALIKSERGNGVTFQAGGTYAAQNNIAFEAEGTTYWHGRAGDNEDGFRVHSSGTGLPVYLWPDSTWRPGMRISGDSGIFAPGKSMMTIDSLDQTTGGGTGSDTVAIKALATNNPTLFYGPTAAGTGSDTVVVYAIDTSGTDTLIDGVKITVVNAGGTDAAISTTEGTGKATFTLDAGTYTLIARRPGPAYQWDSRSLTVSGNDDSVAFKGYNTDNINVCRIYGYLSDLGANYVTNAIVTAKLDKTPIYDTCSDMLVFDREMSTTPTGTNGYWYIDLIPSVCLKNEKYTITVSKSRMPDVSRKETVPDSTTYYMKWGN